MNHLPILFALPIFFTTAQAQDSPVPTVEEIEARIVTLQENAEPDAEAQISTLGEALTALANAALAREAVTRFEAEARHLSLIHI